MDTELSFQSLIDSFVRRDILVERDASNYRHGDGPQFPPFYVFLGADARATFCGVARELLELWPAFSDSMRFVSADFDDDGRLSYWSLRLDNHNEAHAVQLNEDDLLDELENLLNVDKVYSGHMSTVCVYYFIDTSSLTSAEELDVLVDSIPHIQDVLQLGKGDARCSLTILLNRSVRRRVVARELRKRIADRAAHLADSCIDGIFLLSNYRNDGHLDENWDECHRIVALYIALSNCDDYRIVNQLYNKQVLTASYAKVNKPVRDIGQVCVDVLLRGVNTYGAPANRDLLNEDGIEGRLGITDDGTFEVIDRNAAQLINAIVPSLDQLSHFPQDGYRDFSDLSAYTYASFDEACLGALSVYLGIRQREYLRIDGSKKSEWARLYGQQLQAQFSIDELIYLGEHIQDVKTLFWSLKEGRSSGGVIEGAKDKLRRELSRDSAVIALLVRQIEIEAQRARAFRGLWNELLASLTKVHPVENEDSLVAFYERKTNTFLRNKGAELGKQFSKTANVEELRAFLERSINDLIESDDVFAAPFDAELMQRLNEVNDGADAFDWIYSNLTGTKLQTYLQVDFALDEPMVKAVFAEARTRLKERLARALPAQTCFYDTGCGYWIEAMNIHFVDVGNISQ